MELQRYAVERGTVGSGAREHTINVRNVSELIWTPGIPKRGWVRSGGIGPYDGESIRAFLRLVEPEE